MGRRVDGLVDEIDTTQSTQWQPPGHLLKGKKKKLIEGEANS